MVYKWKEGFGFKADAKKCYFEINRLGQDVTPDQLVGYAKLNKMSELHKCFEWDDTKAAHQYRLVQARSVLQSIVFIPTKESKSIKYEIRAFEHYNNEEGESKYSKTTTVLGDKEFRKQVMNSILKTVSEMKIKAEKYSFLSKDFNKIKNKIEQLEKDIMQIMENDTENNETK